MKIAYCIESAYNSGGMERVLSLKANDLCEKLGYDVYVITTDQAGRSNFFEFSDRIRFIDLDVGYKELAGEPFFRKTYLYLKKRRIHYARLKNVLDGLNADIVISMFGKEASMLWRMKDGSKKILERHFSKYMRLMVQQSASMRVINSFRTLIDDIFARRYDRLIVLTQEDGMSWKRFRNLMVIPNPTFMHPDCPATLENKRVIAVGRLCHQKGFDMLVSAWALVHPSEPEWHLDIYGSGGMEGAAGASNNRVRTGCKHQHPSACWEYSKHIYGVINIGTYLTLRGVTACIDRSDGVRRTSCVICMQMRSKGHH